MTLDKPIDGCWINLVNPDSTEITNICREYNIPEDFITYPMDIDERPRTENEDGTILIVLRVPLFQGENADIPYATVPVGIVMTERVIITVYKVENSVIPEMMIGRMRGLSTAKKNRFILHLLLAAATKYLAFLREINRKVDALEDRLQASLGNKEVLELLKYQKSLTLFTTALKSNELMIGRLQKSHLFARYEEDQDLLEDVLTELGQAIEMTNISSGILSQMMDAFASIISNNLNVVMKFLASITIILSLPTVVASIYGMNIHLPLMEFEHAFIIVMGMTLVVTFCVVILFLKRDWL
jgi:magnesium transporter